MRRNARLRREYLYRKSLEGKEREMYEKKLRIKKALEEGKPIPSELKKDELEMRDDLKFDDAKNIKPRNHMDDEYDRSGIEDPKIFITTSRDPSSRLIQFAKELSFVIPNCTRKNRGHFVVRELVNAARANEITDLILVHETRGEPDALIISHLPYGPTAYFALTNVVLRHDISEKIPIPQQYPHLIFHEFSSRLGERVQNILKYLFPVPKDDSKRTITFANQNDYISFRHHTYKQEGKEVKLKEIGPRFEMRLWKIRLGTIEMDQAENEWVLRSFMNSARKATALSNPEAEAEKKEIKK